MSKNKTTIYHLGNESLKVVETDTGLPNQRFKTLTKEEVVFELCEFKREEMMDSHWKVSANKRAKMLDEYEEKIKNEELRIERK